jgi:O-antigen ligase
MLSGSEPGSLFTARLVALAVICLPVLVPALPLNLTPADAPLLVAMVAFAMGAGWTGEKLTAPFAVPVWIIATAGTLAASTGRFPGQGAVAVAQDLYLFLWGATVANVMRRPAAMRVVLRAWTLSATISAGLLVGAIATRQWAIAGVGSGSSRAAFTFGEQNGAALYFVVSIMLVLATRSPYNRALRRLAVAVLVAALVATGSLAGLLGLGAGLGVAAVIVVRDRAGYAAAITALVGVVLVGGLVLFGVSRTGFVDRVKASPNVYVRNSIGREDQSKSERELLARETTALYQSAGPFGRGPASTKDTLEAEQAAYQKEAHDDWVAALVERGVVGLLGVILLAAAIAVRAAAVSRPRHLGLGFRRVVPTPAFVIGALVTVLVFSLTHESLHDRTVWTLLGLLAAMYAWGRRSQSEGASS